MHSGSLVLGEMVGLTDDDSGMRVSHTETVESNPMKIYVSGPMRGIPQFNFPAFDQAASRLRSEGNIVFNPAEEDRRKYGHEIASYNNTGDEAVAALSGFNLRDVLARDMDWICRQADAVAMLPGWETSRGATAEKATAEALGLAVIFLDG